MHTANTEVFVDADSPFLACARPVTFYPTLDCRSQLFSTSSFVAVLSMPAPVEPAEFSKNGRSLTAH